MQREAAGPEGPATVNDRDDVRIQTTRRARHDLAPVGDADRRLDRLAEDIACSLCFMERGQLDRLAAHLGGIAEVVRILATVRRRWGDFAVAAARILDEHPDALIAADEVDLLCGLVDHDPRTVTAWASWQDPSPFVGRIVSVLRFIDRVQTVRGYAVDAFAVWASLDGGQVPDPAAWARLRAGVDGLVELGEVA